MGKGAAVLAVLGLLIFANAARARQARQAPLRVRKSIFSLSQKEFAMYVQGVSTMLSVNTEQGRKLYGPKYKDMEYFVVKHATNAYTPVKGLDPGDGPANDTNCYSPANTSHTAVFMVSGTCDVAHDGPWFVTFHIAFILEFENALLSVVPGLRAVPYWEMYEEFRGTPELPGKYYKSPKAMLSPANFGSIPGDPDDGWMVKDGLFRDWMVPDFTPAICKARGYPACDVYNGSRAGLLRQYDNNLTQPRIIRFPYSALAEVESRAYLAGGPEINFTRKDFARCTNTSIVKSVVDYVHCIDIYSIQVGGVDTQGFSYSNPLYTNGTDGFLQLSAYHHPLYHNMIGSLKPGSVSAALPFGLLGDARTTSTSPNEPWLFFPFHENLMRGFAIWQQEAARLDPRQAHADLMWGYPKKATPVPPIVRQGTGLDDLLSPRMPFTDLWPGIPPKGITHRDMLNWQPDYTYDVMRLD